MTIPVKKLRRILTRVALEKPLSDADAHYRGKCLHERWVSVEAMLRWLIADRYAECARTERALRDAGPLYPLRKPTDGVPVSFTTAFPGTWDEWALSTALKGLDGMARALEKAEAALSSGDYPKAIWWLDAATRTKFSALALWNSGGAVRMWRFNEMRRAKNAENRRGKRRDATTALTVAALTDFRDDYIAREGHRRGWKKAAATHFRVSVPTITKVADGAPGIPKHSRGGRRAK